MIYWKGKNDLTHGIYNYMLENKKKPREDKIYNISVTKDSEGLLYGFLTHLGPRHRPREWRLLAKLWASPVSPSSSSAFSTVGADLWMGFT